MYIYTDIIHNTHSTGRRIYCGMSCGPTINRFNGTEPLPQIFPFGWERERWISQPPVSVPNTSVDRGCKATPVHYTNRPPIYYPCWTCWDASPEDQFDEIMTKPPKWRFSVVLSLPPLQMMMTGWKISNFSLFMFVERAIHFRGSWCNFLDSGVNFLSLNPGIQSDSCLQVNVSCFNMWSL